MASGIILKVEPSVLISQSNQVSAEINKIERYWSNIQNYVSKTKSYWEGDASNLHQRYFNDLKNDVNQIIKRLKEHPKDLLEMAKLYEQAEREASSLSISLPSDVIV